MTLPPVAELLPHGPGMVLLDRLRASGPDWLQSEITIRPASRFADAGRGVPAWVGIEYMAQTIAAFEGLARVRAGKPVQIGLLLGSRAYDARVARFAFGWRLVADVRQLLRAADGVTAFACELRREDGTPLASAEIKAYQPDDIGPFLDTLRAEAP